ncbi:MAG TPA: 3-phosphoshikimate 1-carboxyvinyltransferase [Syntrophorhabdales bacterium]|nr:3-phosphoshikimate 1-carboxyvinyltransferase [Syntrophorhabdales bacterium]
MKFIKPSAVKGRVAAPPSKSMMGRALAAALLANGTSRIYNPSFCDDAMSALGIIKALGARIEAREGVLAIHGTGKQALIAKGTVLDCGESGLCMRMFTPIAALQDKEITLLASGSLGKRPMDMVEELLPLGASCTTDHGHAPIKVRGPMKGGHVSINGAVSSQLLTGLLMALPFCEQDSLMKVTHLKSSPYVQMTIGLLEKFGIRIEHDARFEEFFVKGNQVFLSSDYIVEGDWSGASFLLVAGALTGSVTVTGLDLRSFQADRAILQILTGAGASVQPEKDRITVRKGFLNAFECDATDCPDLFPPLVALASGCEGKSVIHGLHRLKHKESDRAAALASEFQKLGISIRMMGNALEVQGGNVREAMVDAHNDHRIAMSCAVAALRADGRVGVNGEESVAKSYPDFFSDLESIREAP